jgi:hypothetical protein
MVSLSAYGVAYCINPPRDSVSPNSSIEKIN